MWGVLVQIAGARVNASVPGWLMNAAATQVAVDQIRHVAHELAARPDHYGFDPDAVYTLLFQTWDRSTSSLRSVAFGRDRAGQSAVGLLPDPYYMHSRGYRALRRAAGALPPWTSRSDRIAWRGSVTGDNTIAPPEDLPRIRLSMLCHDDPDMDVGLIGVHSTMNNGREPGALDAFINARGLVKERWDMASFGRYKYTIDIDGHANAWGLLEKFILGCCVLKVESPYKQWFYARLKPWHHYVPVRADLSDLTEIVAWCRANEAQCSWIAHNGMQLAAALTLEREIPAMCRTVLTAAHARRSKNLRRPSAVVMPRFLLEDAVGNAEDRGQLNQAIAALSRLVDDGDTRWETLMRRHDFLRQRGDFAAAQVDMETAISVGWGVDEPPLRLAQFHALIGQHVSAVRLFEVARRLAPDRIEIAVVLAASCLKLEWLDRAFWTVRELPADLPGWWADVRRDAITRFQSARARVLPLLAAARDEVGLTSGQRLELATLLNKLGRTRLAQSVSDTLPADSTSACERSALARAILTRRDGLAAALHNLELERNNDDVSLAYRTSSAEILYELGSFQSVLDEAHQAGLSNAPLRLLEVAACSAAMLGRSTDVVATCSTWMTRSPNDYKPAELLCSTQALPDSISRGPDHDKSTQIGQFGSAGAMSGPIRAAMDSWSEHHRSAHQQIFDEERARAFLSAHFDTEMVRAYDLCELADTKAQYFRFAWLHRNGGCWVASDQRCLRPAEDVLARAMESNLTTIRSGHMTGYVQDCFVAAKPASVVIEAACKAATAAIIGAAERDEPLWAWNALGAGLLTRLAAAALCRPEERGNIVLLAPMIYDSFAVTVPFA